MCGAARSNSGSERRNLTLDLLCTRDADLLFYDVLIQVKERILITIDRTPIMSFESRSLGEFNPVCNLH